MQKNRVVAAALRFLPRLPALIALPVGFNQHRQVVGFDHRVVVRIEPVAIVIGVQEEHALGAAALAEQQHRGLDAGIRLKDASGQGQHRLDAVVLDQ